MNLLIDIGNTACKVAFSEGTTIGKIFRYSGDDFASFVVKTLKRESPHQRPHIAVLSNVRADNAHLEEVLREQCCDELYVLNSALVDKLVTTARLLRFARNDDGAAGHADVPAPGHAAVPAAGHADVPAAGHAAVSAADVPAAGHADVPAPGHADVSAADVPAVGHADVPAPVPAPARIFEVLDNMPEGMGADRIAAILAAHSLFEDRDLMVFDFGTATTVEFIDGHKRLQDGTEINARYLGGSISLGLNTRYRALSHFTERIPLLNPNDFLKSHDINEISTIGYDLDTALASGNILGIIFEIQGYMNLHPERLVILTGGDAIYFAERLKSSIFVFNNLVLMGLSLIAQHYTNNSDE